jgi:hypothetical protein
MEPNPGKTERQKREQFLAAHKKWLVERGDKIGQLAGGKRDWASQARGIWEAARTETEPLVLLNLLRYQSTRNRNWDDVAPVMEQDIKECQTKAQAVGMGNQGAMELIRLLLVYTIRAYVYESKRNAQNRPRPRP